jgi:SAM-dependent methyltransferase
MRDAPGKSIQDRINALVYFSRRVVKTYVQSALYDSEIAALLKYQPFVAAHDVLDLGVGTGRTTRFLAPLARRYECLDYSPAMVEYMRRAMPHVAVQMGDIRDLGAFAAGSFDFVLAPCNLISAVSLDDRLIVLREIRRVLRTGGVCMFSSHNRNYRLALSGPRLGVSRNPVTQLTYVIKYLQCWRNHYRIRKYRQIGNEHALLDDSGHDYALLHLYVSRSFQVRQLTELGFSVADVFDTAGNALSGSDDDSSSDSLLYVAISC